jgi:hypothetical protein
MRSALVQLADDTPFHVVDTIGKLTGILIVQFILKSTAGPKFVHVAVMVAVETDPITVKELGFDVAETVRSETGTPKNRSTRPRRRPFIL